MVRRLTEVFLKALELARDSIGGVAAATGLPRRTLTAYRGHAFEVNPRAARALVRHLRRRARALNAVADALERTAKDEERKK